MTEQDLSEDGEALTFEDGVGVFHASKWHLPACGAWLNNGLQGPYPGTVTCLWCLSNDDYPYAIGDDGRGEPDDIDDGADFVQTNTLIDEMRKRLGP